MKRIILALLLLPSLAFAQSDNRRVAVFYTDGAKGLGGARNSGDIGASATVTSQTTHVVRIALNRMGIPYDVFLASDSTKGWNSVMRTPGGRPAGMADSTWFRQNGYMGLIFVLASVGSGAEQTYEIVKYFTDGTNRGVQQGSPFDGNWGIPVLCLSIGAARNPGVPFVNGAYGVVGPTGSELVRSMWPSPTGETNGDSLGYQTALVAQLSVPAETSSVTRIITSGDSLSSYGTRMKAWRYKTSLYNYYVGGGIATFTRPAGIILGLADFFRAARYTPRRKLGLHWTLDHIYPEKMHRTAPSDTFMTYVRALGLRFSTAIKAHANERVDAEPEIRSIWDAEKNHFPAFPHSHVTGIGNYADGTSWNFSTYADTSTIAARWNFLERAISDTMALVPARGYERTIGFPGDGVHFPHLYIFAQDGYTDIRSTTSDSIGQWSNLNAGKRVFSGPTAGGANGMFLPTRWIEPSTGKTIWIHGLQTFPGSADTTWKMLGDLSKGDGIQSVDGYAASYINSIARAILYDEDFYWHPNENLEGENVSGGSNDIMAVFMRRFTYFYGRVSNIVEVSPSYKAKTPRRSTVTSSIVPDDVQLKWFLTDWRSPSNWSAADLARDTDRASVSYRWTAAPLSKPCLAAYGPQVLLWDYKPREDDPRAIAAYNFAVANGVDKINGTQRIITWTGAAPGEGLLQMDVRDTVAMRGLADLYANEDSLSWAAGLHIDYYSQPCWQTDIFPPGESGGCPCLGCGENQFITDWRKGLAAFVRRYRATKPGTQIMIGQQYQEDGASCAELDGRFIEQDPWRWHSPVSGALAWHESQMVLHAAHVINGLAGAHVFEIRHPEWFTQAKIEEVKAMCKSTGAYISLGRDGTAQEKPLLLTQIEEE